MKKINSDSCIFCENCYSSSIFYSNFFGNKFAKNGGAISFISSGTFQKGIISNYTIVNSNFIENESFENGGAIYFISGKLYIRNCNFLINLALNGGAIYYKNECNLFIFI